MLARWQQCHSGTQLSHGDGRQEQRFQCLRIALQNDARRCARFPLRTVMFDRLGRNVWHRTPAEACAVLEQLEEAARLWLMTCPPALTDAQLNGLRQKFGAR